MTIEQLEKQLQDNLAAELAKAAEREKRLPTPFKIGPGDTVQSAAMRLGMATYGQLKHNRSYSADKMTTLEVGAVTEATLKSRANLTHVFEVFASVIPGWKQERPAEDAGTIPPLPICPATGQRVRNPWLPLPPLKPGETTPHFDHGSQAMIREQSPRLAKWLEDCAKNGGQPSMKMLDELDGERIEAEHMRKIQYGEKEWQENKLRPGSEATLTEQNLWTRSITDPWLLQFHRREAKLGSPRLKFDNLTVRMALAKRDPQVREVHRQAEEILKAWQAETSEKAA